MAPSRESEPVDHYRVLGVDPAASASEIAAAYRVQVRRHHPDIAHDGDAEEFRRVQTAYDVLADPNRRADYDQVRRRAAAGLDPPTSGRGVRIPVHRREAAHRHGHRESGDRQIDVAISFPQAALGGTIAVTDPHGELVHLRVPAGTDPNTTLRVTGHGALAGRERGDLYVTVQIDVPKDLTDEQRRSLEAFAATLDAPSTPATHREERDP